MSPLRPQRRRLAVRDGKGKKPGCQYFNAGAQLDLEDSEMRSSAVKEAAEASRSSRASRRWRTRSRAHSGSMRCIWLDAALRGVFQRGCTTAGARGRGQTGSRWDARAVRIELGTYWTAMTFTVTFMRVCTGPADWSILRVAVARSRFALRFYCTLLFSRLYTPSV